MEKKEDYLPSYGYKTIFYFSPAITIVFTPSFAAAMLDEAGMIVGSGPLGCESPLLVGSNMKYFKRARHDRTIDHVCNFYPRTKDRSQIALIDVTHKIILSFDVCTKSANFLFLENF